MRTPVTLAAVAFPILTLLFPPGGVRAEPPPPAWVNISDPIVNQLAAEGKKQDWPGNTAGVVCDPTTGHLYLALAGQGIWKSTDRGATFARIDAGSIGGRCETSFSLHLDPAGKRLACFMLDGKSAFTTDAGATWKPMTSLGRNWDYAAVDWSAKDVATIFAARHEVGGEVYLSTDAGQNWKLLWKDPAWEKRGGLGIFDATTLVRHWPGRGIERSADAGATWTKVSDLKPHGRVVIVRGPTAYWLSPDGLLISKDKGVTWEKIGDQCPGAVGPMLDPGDDKHFATAGPKGIYETTDGGRSWTLVATLPAKFDFPMPGWYTNVTWDPANRLFYTSKMGMPTYKLEAPMPR
jgi:photosystem II stability/assembly factor-like uncharacterized protein